MPLPHTASEVNSGSKILTPSSSGPPDGAGPEARASGASMVSPPLVRGVHPVVWGTKCDAT